MTIPIVRKVQIGYQEPITIADYVSTLATGSSVSFETPIEGYSVIFGQVYSSQTISLDVEQGVDDRGGTLTYDHSIPTVTVAAGTTEARIVPVHGNFARVTLTNASGFTATIRANFDARGIA